MSIEFLEKVFKIDVSLYKDGFTNEQRLEIAYGLVRGIDVSKYANPDISAIKMFSIRKFLENEGAINIWRKKHIDISKYRDRIQSVQHLFANAIKLNLDTRLMELPEYNDEQVREIFYGLSLGQDVEYFTGRKFKASAMKVLRGAGEDLRSIARDNNTAAELTSLNNGLKLGYDMSKFVMYDAQSIDIFIECLKNDINYEPLLNKALTYRDRGEMYRGLANGI